MLTVSDMLLATLMTLHTLLKIVVAPSCPLHNNLSLSTTPSPISSLHEYGVEDFWSKFQETIMEKSRMPPKREKRKDAHEPYKPVSAYALFFHDTQVAREGQNSTVTLGEFSEIVKSIQAGVASQCRTTVELDLVTPLQTLPLPLATVDPAAPAPATIEPPALFPSTVVQSMFSSHIRPSYITKSQGWMLTVIPVTVVTSQGLQLDQANWPSQYSYYPAQSSSLDYLSVSVASSSSSVAFYSSHTFSRPRSCLYLRKFESIYKNSQFNQLTTLLHRVRLYFHQTENTDYYQLWKCSTETIHEMITDVQPEADTPQMEFELLSGSPVTLSPQA
ncbi:TOX high mobility group box family member 4 [Galemys pyrenaicus]|uniref:TOX high mobility group box family member 4 n=1 Tax=Galemys pyrenaicus TaxID=202257 RepID=A0A8J6DBX0_GALPY|nr:TOX high mobility group box family member 4 [Galemys pyrenaicus]